MQFKDVIWLFKMLVTFLYFKPIKDVFSDNLIGLAYNRNKIINLGYSLIFN